jgi:hypothetical protein
LWALALTTNGFCVCDRAWFWFWFWFILVLVTVYDTTDKCLYIYLAWPLAGANTIFIFSRVHARTHARAPRLSVGAGAGFDYNRAHF